jgi:DNA-binding transcriptional regulator YdaS (Cro superfamily)
MKRDKLEDLDVGERHRLAKLVPTSEPTLRQIANGTRQASAGMAIKIERAAAKIGLKIFRSDLAAGCAMCEYARECERRRIK